MGHVCPPVVVGSELRLHAMLDLQLLLWNTGGCGPAVRFSQGVGVGRALSGVCPLALTGWRENFKMMPSQWQHFKK